MLHFCKFNLEFLGLGYDLHEPSINTYGIVYFELYRCKKCKKLFYEHKIKTSDTFIQDFEFKLRQLRSMGYKPIGELLHKSN